MPPLIEECVNVVQNKKNWELFMWVGRLPLYDLVDMFDCQIYVIVGKKKKNNMVISEAHPESEYNPTRDVLEGDDHITVQDLLDPIQGKPGYSKLRKRVQHMDRKSASIQAPLPKADREKLERMAVYEHSKKDITKWEHLVKRNREAPTIFFSEDIDLGFSTVGAIASEFEPRTEFEKKIASLVYDDKVMEAHKEDGSKLLEMNKVWVFLTFLVH